MATKFDFQRQEFTLRLSRELDSLVSEFAQAVDSTKTDIILFVLCDTLDPTGVQCPDSRCFPPRLRDNLRHPVDRLTQAQRANQRKFMDFFSKSVSTDTDLEEDVPLSDYGGDDISDEESEDQYDME